MAGKRKVNDKLLAKIKQLYVDGVTGKDIAKQLGVSKTTIYKALSKEGVAKKRGEYRKYTPEIRKEMVRLHEQQELSCSEVAKKLNVSISVVSYAVRAVRVIRPKANEVKNVIMFTCKMCGNVKPLSDLMDNRRFRPPIYCCRDCAIK